MLPSQPKQTKRVKTRKFQTSIEKAEVDAEKLKGTAREREFENDLPPDVVDDLSELEIVEHFDVVRGLLPQLVALLVAKHVSVDAGGVHLGPTRQMHLDQVFDL